MCDSPARAVLDVYVVRPRSVYAVPLVPPDPWLPKPSAGADVTPVAVHWIKQLFFKKNFFGHITKDICVSAIWNFLVYLQ